MILVIAPFAGEAPERSPFLAAAKKTLFLLNIIKNIDDNVVLLNSGHREFVRKKISFTYINIGNGKVIPMVTPDTYDNAWIGRLMNIIQVPSILKFLVGHFGKPDIVWLYNGYAFESKAGRYLSKKYGAKIILEFEDWHFARGRGLNPKPFIDWYYWYRSLKYIDYAFAVNYKLSKVLAKHGIPVRLLPGVISDVVGKVGKEAPPFVGNTDMIKVGYFGGLFKEKGALFLLDLMKIVPPGIKFFITGNGEYKDAFVEFSNTFPEKLTFFGTVTDIELTSIIKNVDVIVNAHKKNNGIFPFKILESVASGRLVISTDLEMDGYQWLEKAIVFCELELGVFNETICNSRHLFKKKKMDIQKAAETALRLFTSTAIQEQIEEAISN